MQRTTFPRKPAVWLFRDGLKSPPMSEAARIEAGMALRKIQRGQTPDFPLVRPMPDIGPRCGEIRVADGDSAWRVFYRADEDRVLLVHLLQKKTQTTPHDVIDLCCKRLADYDRAMRKRSKK